MHINNTHKHARHNMGTKCLEVSELDALITSATRMSTCDKHGHKCPKGGGYHGSTTHGCQFKE